MTQLTDAIQSIVRAQLKELVFSSLQLATVDSDEGDTCTATISGGQLNGHTLRLIAKTNGIPKTKTTLSNGTKILISFLDADSTRPFIAGYLQDTPAQRVEIFSRGKNAAGKGDGVDCGTLLFTPGSGGAALAYLEPGVEAPPAPPSGVPMAIPLSGLINEGNPDVDI